MDNAVKQENTNPMAISMEGLAQIGMEKDVLIYNLKAGLNRLSGEFNQLKAENEKLKAELSNCRSEEPQKEG